MSAETPVEVVEMVPPMASIEGPIPTYDELMRIAPTATITLTIVFVAVYGTYRLVRPRVDDLKEQIVYLQEWVQRFHDRHDK